MAVKLQESKKKGYFLNFITSFSIDVDINRSKDSDESKNAVE